MRRRVPRPPHSSGRSERRSVGEPVAAEQHRRVASVPAARSRRRPPPPMLAVLPTVAAGFAAPLVIPTTEIAPGVHLPMAGLGTWQYNSSVAEAA
eukprot:1758309-Prymnesium_polylepis.1